MRQKNAWHWWPNGWTWRATVVLLAAGLVAFPGGACADSNPEMSPPAMIPSQPFPAGQAVPGGREMPMEASAPSSVASPPIEADSQEKKKKKKETRSIYGGVSVVSGGGFSSVPSIPRGAGFTGAPAPQKGR